MQACTLSMFSPSFDTVRPPEAVAKFKQEHKQLVKQLQPDPKLTRLPSRHIIGSL